MPMPLIYPMTLTEKLFPILDKLDIDRIERAINHPQLTDQDGWGKCFLALYYGEPGELQARCYPAWRDIRAKGQYKCFDNFVAEAVGLTPDEVTNVINEFDDFMDEFKKTVIDYLEAKPIPRRTSDVQHDRRPEMAGTP